MRIATNKEFKSVIITKCGNGWMLTIGAVRKFFDNEQTAIATINNMGYQF